VLEERTVPTNIVNFGGPTIPHVQVNNIVMGAQPLDTSALMQALVQDYLPLLGPNYGIGAGTLRSSISITPLPGSPSDAQIQKLIVQEINSGAVPPPDGNQVYFVFLAQGQGISDTQGSDILGYHSGFSVVHDATGYHQVTYFSPGEQIIPVTYAISFGGGTIPLTASHELAEAVTDPGSFPAFMDQTLLAAGEVADIYDRLLGFNLDGYQVAILSGPQGQKIGIVPPATPQNLFTLAIEQAEALLVGYLAFLDPPLAAYAKFANVVLNSNLLYGTPQGQIGVLLGNALFSNWLAPQNGG
jgi:hypothetical protein